MPKTKIEEVYDFLLPELKALGVEDTDDPEIRYWALRGLVDGWKEDTSDDDNFEKIFWILAVESELMRLKMKLQFPSILK